MTRDLPLIGEPLPENAEEIFVAVEEYRRKKNAENPDGPQVKQLSVSLGPKATVKGVIEQLERLDKQGAEFVKIPDDIKERAMMQMRKDALTVISGDLDKFNPTDVELSYRLRLRMAKTIIKYALESKSDRELRNFCRLIVNLGQDTINSNIPQEFLSLLFSVEGIAMVDYDMAYIDEYWNEINHEFN